ncbi:hypothetical protein C0Z17_29830, partial [Trinickia caryophylli]
EVGTGKVWGYNYYGQLGMGDTTNRRTLVTVPGLSEVKQLSAGNYHTLALLEDGTVKVWGSKTSGALGLEGDLKRPTVLMLAPKSLFPKLKVIGLSDSTISARYYLDNETVPRETKNLKLTGNSDTIS